MKINSSIDKRIEVSSDLISLDLIISNYLKNAILYSPEGSNIAIEAEDMNEKVRLSIKDQGEGIPDKYKQRVFERFFRGDKGRSLSKGGTGLGLSIVKNLASVSYTHLTLPTILLV